MVVQNEKNVNFIGAKNVAKLAFFNKEIWHIWDYHTASIVSLHQIIWRTSKMISKTISKMISLMMRMKLKNRNQFPELPHGYVGVLFR